MPGRNFTSSSSYKYGFNGKEKDDEIKGNGNSLDFGARMYDPRLGRWMSVDPLAAKYFDLSPYNFAGNSPILFYDVDGMKFVNPYTKLATAAALNVTKSQAAYDEFAKNNPQLSSKQLKKSQEAKALASVQDELNSIKAKEAEVDAYINTLKVTNKTEYDYFENLKDKQGNEIEIVTYVEGENPTRTNVASTDGLGAKAFSDGTYIPTAPKGITITLFTKGHGAPDPEYAYAGGRNYNSFANELGDIKYHFDNVKDKASFDYGWLSGSSSNKEYNDPKGAGQQSFNYERARVNDVKNYKTKEGEKKDPIRNTVTK